MSGYNGNWRDVGKFTIQTGLKIMAISTESKVDRWTQICTQIAQ
jgi:hypothetical protein